MVPVRLVHSLLTLSLVAGLSAVARAAPTGGSTAGRGATVPTPHVTGPVTGGTETGGPQAASTVPLSPHGFVEQEFFFSGQARNYGSSAATTPTATYESRMLVRRPADPKKFNGTVVVEWFNVSGQSDGDAWDVNWAPLAFRDGYAFVSISASRSASTR